MTKNTLYTKLQELLSHPEHQKVLLETFSLITDIIKDSSEVPKETKPQNQPQSRSNNEETHTDSPSILEPEDDPVHLKKKEAIELGIDLQDFDWWPPEKNLLERIQKKIDEFKALPIIEPSKPRPFRPQRSLASPPRKSKSNLVATLQSAQDTTLEDAMAIASKILEKDD